MMRVVVFAVLLGSCTESHSPGVRALTNEECYTCHVEDFAAATGHSLRSTACENCHRTSAWQPALSDHPDTAFPIAAGPHRDAKCLVCHDLDSTLPSTAGANTDCIQCHPNSSEQMSSHVGATSLTGAPYSYDSATRNFCLSCHPKGQAGKHPDNRFPRTGDHNVPCLSCHLRADGPDDDGMNTSCVESGCHHTLSWSDAKHREEGAYSGLRGNGSNKHFCLASGCHPDGRE